MNTAGNQLVKRVAIVGPECTGKTALSHALAAHYHTEWVPEFARAYIDQLNRPYQQDDLLTIARGQLKAEDELALRANHILICDTTLLVIKVWSDYKFGSCHEEILTMLNKRQYDHHFLTDIDVPWEDDPQREHPDKRKFFFDIYLRELTRMGVSFTRLSGNLTQRMHTAIPIIDSILL